MKAKCGVNGWPVLGLLLFTSMLGAAQKPELVVQTGHSQTVETVAFSQDGKLLASGSGDGAIKLWDVKSGVMLRSLLGYADTVYSIAFSPDGTKLASANGNATVKIWDIQSGKELRSLTGHTLFVWAIAFSPDGKTLASGSGDSTIKLWDAESGKEIRTISGHTDLVGSVAFSPDGSVLASGSDDKTIKLWDWKTGTELRSLSGHTKAVRSVAFSPHERLLASGGYDGTIRLWDVDSGREKFILHGEVFATFSSDGKILAFVDNDTVKLWDLEAGKEIRTITGHSFDNGAVAFSHDGTVLASGSNNNTIKLWDWRTGNELRTLAGHAFVSESAFSPDEKTLAFGSENTVKLWDLEKGDEIRTLSGQSASVFSVAFSPDGKTLASGSGDDDHKSIKIWDLKSSTVKWTFPGDRFAVWSLAFSPNGQVLASGGLDKIIKLWDLEQGTALRNLPGHLQNITLLKFSADGKILASASSDAIVKLWDVDTGKELHTLTGHSGTVGALLFSPDAKSLVSANLDSIKLWDAKSGTLLISLDKNETLQPPKVGDLYRIFWSGVDPGEKILKSFLTFYFEVGGEAVSERFTVHETEEAQIHLFDRNTAKELATLTAFNENDWLVTTPDGLFDGTPTAWKQLMWRFDNNTFSHAPVEAFFNEFFYPGLLQEILQGKTPKPPLKDLSKIDIRQPEVRITRADGQAVIQNSLGLPAVVAAPAGDRKVEVALEITDNVQAPLRPTHPKTSGAQDIRLFRNGSLVKLWTGDAFVNESKCQQLPAREPLAPRRSLCTVTVPIVGGENRFTAYAFNSDNVKSSDATLTVTGADTIRRKGVAYLLTVGINQYSNAGYNLRYAVADAQDFAQELKRQQTKLGNYNPVEVISLNDTGATKANILKVLTDLPAKIQPEDAVVIYFAGHGTAQGNRFYLIPHDLGYTGNPKRLDEVGLQTILSHGISDVELERAIEGIDAGQLLLVIDACNSGQALEEEEKRRGPMNSKGLAQLAYEKGMYILTAAQSYQAALEATKLGHGYLTYALVEEGLKTPAADIEPKDNQLLLREWLDYATNRVPQMQQETIERGARGLGIEVIFVEGDERIKDPNKRNLQRPRVFYRRETETTPFVVAKP